MKRIDKYTEELVRKDKRNGKSLKYIMTKYNIKSIQTVYSIMKREDKEYIIANKRYNVDENYFDYIDTEEKSYWLGFLYADGYVRLKYNRSGELKLKLKRSDKEHIKLFKNCINSTHKIKNEKSIVKVNNKIHKSYNSYISIYNTHMVKKLFEHGCINNKTFKIKFPSWLDENLKRHFIRGYFDGDGSVGDRKKSVRITISSGSIIFLDELKDELVNNCCVTNINRHDINIKWNKKEDFLKIYNYLYKDSTIYLKRKKEKFDDIINNKTREIVAIVENDNIIKKWKHINDCSKELKIGTRYIMKMCNNEIDNPHNLKLIKINFFD